jgi:hypothetical protein
MLNYFKKSVADDRQLVGVMMAIHKHGLAAEQTVEQFGLGGDFFGDSRLIELSGEGVSPELAVGKKMSVAANQSGGWLRDQRRMPAIRQHDVEADIQVWSIREQPDGCADVFAGDCHQAGGGHRALAVRTDDSAAGIDADAEVVCRNHESERNSMGCARG